MKRKIIIIDENLCNGCGQCIPNCPEGAIQMIDGKARLISDLFCDGLGACLGHCPVGAIAIEEREADPYDERKVMANIIRQGPNVVRAHLEHLRDHKEDENLRVAVEVLRETGQPNPLDEKGGAARGAAHPGCPGSRTVELPRADQPPAAPAMGGEGTSTLQTWPLQLHLISPMAPHFAGCDLLLAADCTAFALGSFHSAYLKGRPLAIACPKLDDGQDVYVEKLRILMDDAKINTLTVMIMQVPCCRGLLEIARTAAARAARRVPVKCVVVGVRGDILQEDWVTV